MNFTTPVGRIVYGSVWEGSDRDRKGQQRIIKTGPNAGKPAFMWNFGLAIPKFLAAQPGQAPQPNHEMNAFIASVHEVARAGYPQFMNGPVDAITGKPGPSHPRFAMKIADGDGMDGDGKPNNQKEGWAGHWVIKFSGMYSPRVFDINIGLDPTQQLQDKSRVLPGDFAAVSGTCEPNIGSDVPGVYMNGNMVCFVGVGTRIVSGPKAADVFGKLNLGMLPPGCVPGATPANVPMQPQMPQQQQQPQYTPPPPAAMPQQPQYTPPPMQPQQPQYTPPQQVTPNMGYVHQAAGQVAPPPLPTPPMQPQAPQIMLTPAAIQQGYTVESFTANGWTYEMMKQHGFAL